MALAIIYGIFWIYLLIGSLVARVKGSILLAIFIVLTTAMIFLRNIIDSTLASVGDSMLFILLLLWIVVINKHCNRRRKDQ